MSDNTNSDGSTTTLGSDGSTTTLDYHDKAKPFNFRKRYSSVQHTVSESDSNEDSHSVCDVSKRRKTEESAKESKPACQYGASCYRKNSDHLREYFHPSSSNSTNDKEQSSIISSDNSKSMVPWSNCFGIYVSRVHGLSQGSVPQISLSEILSNKMGKLKSSAQFNYMFEIEWLRSQYPPEFRNLPLLLVHGEQGASKCGIDMEAAQYSNITTCQARLDMPYGTHHTKMMLLLYEDGIRIVIMTANLIERDWNKKTQGIWISNKLPRLSSDLQSQNDEIVVADSDTNFKRDLLLYLTSYNHSKIRAWMQEIEKYDFSSVKVYLVGSTPGRHKDGRFNEFGHTKIKKILQENRPHLLECNQKWPLIGQFSSIGRLGNQASQWLLNEWRRSFVVDNQKDVVVESEMNARQNTKLIFPCVNDVRESLEGYMAGGSLPYSINTAKNQIWLNLFLHKWNASYANRSRASPHIKCYTRTDPHFKLMPWFLLTSANLSKAAWGSFEKQSSQLMIRSYELGVMFLPHQFGMQHFSIKTNSDSDKAKSINAFPVPFDIPPTPYGPNDFPWIVDIAYGQNPDCLGNYWIPK